MINMARETKAQKASRLTFLLGEYDAKSRELRKLTKQVDELKEKIKAEDAGTYGDWAFAYGTPREILDQPAARAALKEAGLEVPLTMTSAPIVVTNTAASGR